MMFLIIYSSFLKISLLRVMMGSMSPGSGVVPSFPIQHRSRTPRSIDCTFTVRLWCLVLQRIVGRGHFYILAASLSHNSGIWQRAVQPRYRFENVKVSKRRVMNAKHLGIQMDHADRVWALQWFHDKGYANIVSHPSLLPWVESDHANMRPSTTILSRTQRPARCAALIWQLWSIELGQCNLG